MTIDDLISELEEARDALGGQAEVRIAYQPSWPLRAALAHVTVPLDDQYEEGEWAAGQDRDSGMLWLAAGSELPWDENPYAPRWAWRHGEASRS
jgi:hypothetical protein